MEDKEKVVSRVVGFLYDALDNFRTTMEDVNNSIETLMGSLTKVERDLQTLGVQPKKSAPLRADELAARIKAGTSMTSRQRLIGLFTGQPTASPISTTSSIPTSSTRTPTKPTPAISVSGPPKAISTSGPLKPMVGPPKTMVGPPKPMVGPPKTMTLPTKPTIPAKTPSPPVKMTPPTIPSMKPPMASSTQPPIMKPPSPPLTPKPMAAPSTAASPKPGGSIIGLRDEMLKELKRLKSIMKGG